MFAVDGLEAVLARLPHMAPNSSAGWSGTRTAAGSATSTAPRASSWRWPSRSTEAVEGVRWGARPPGFPAGASDRASGPPCWWGRASANSTGERQSCARWDALLRRQPNGATPHHRLAHLVVPRAGERRRSYPPNSNHE
jgi:hypothetical protein